MKDYFLESSKPSVKITVKKKKKKYVAETGYLNAEGETEAIALKNLAVELRLLATSIEEMLEGEETR